MPVIEPVSILFADYTERRYCSGFLTGTKCIFVLPYGFEDSIRDSEVFYPDEYIAIKSL